MIRSAVMSEDRQYRYILTRRWGTGSLVAWIMLNPSTADAVADDPTIRRCVNLSRAWGFAALEVVNLYALRASEPAMVRRHRDPVGPDNDGHLFRSVRSAHTVVAAWGAFPWAAARIEAVEELVPGLLMCLGRTRDGFPKHPLYVPRTTRLVEYRAATSSPGTRSPRPAPHPCPQATPSPSARPRCPA